MSQDLCAELRSLQSILAGQANAPEGSTLGRQTAWRPLQPTDDGSSSSDDDHLQQSPVRKIKAGKAGSSVQPQLRVQELERQLGALQQKVTEEGDRARRLEAALEATQQDSALVANRLKADIATKQEESAQLAELLLALREEADGLRQELNHATAAAHQNGQSTQASLAQLQSAAAEWRRQGEDSLEALAEEQERCAVLAAEVSRLRVHADSLQRQLDEERESRQSAAAAAATATPEILADLRARLAQERAWRKAVCHWLEGEMATRADLERVLVNIGAAARTGTAAGSRTSWSVHGRASVAPPPPLPPRHMTGSQVAQMPLLVRVPAQPQRPASPAVQVTVRSPPGGHMMVGVDVGPGAPERSQEGIGMEGVSDGRPRSSARRTCSNGSNGNSAGSGSRCSASTAAGSAGSGASPGAGRGDWRQHFKETMQAFDERHSRLQAELSTLRREALIQAM